jgi:hypothetical protein
MNVEVTEVQRQGYTMFYHLHGWTFWKDFRSKKWSGVEDFVFVRCDDASLSIQFSILQINTVLSS